MPRKTPVTPKARSSADERESPVARIALFSIQSVGSRAKSPLLIGEMPLVLRDERSPQVSEWTQLIENKAPKSLHADPFLAPKVLL